MTPQDFQAEMEALMKKYEGVCTLVAVPTNLHGKDGYWHPDAEIRVAVVPSAPTGLGTNDGVTGPGVNAPIIQS